MAPAGNQAQQADLPRCNDPAQNLIADVIAKFQKRACNLNARIMDEF
jgi:hypothetical protein